MIVYFKKNGEHTRNVEMVEHEVMTPTIPANMEVSERIEYLNQEGLTYISLPYELGGAIFNYKVCINDNEEFIGLQPKNI